MKLLLFLIYYGVFGKSFSDTTFVGERRFGDTDIDFCIITSMSEEKKIKFNDMNGLTSSKFDKNLDTVFVIHGYLDGHRFIKKFQRAYFGQSIKHKANLIGIDWSKGSYKLLYPKAVANTKLVGDVVARFISSAVNNDSLYVDSVQVIGHSLGAQIAGLIGKNLKTKHIDAPWITALDPAGPLFTYKDCKKRLCRTDAKFVEVIHTNGKVFGFYKPCGYTDFYLNGGKRQPNCLGAPICSHLYAYKWYQEILNCQNRILGWLCESIDDMEQHGKCDNPRNPLEFFGSKPQPREEGVIYMPYPDTNTFNNGTLVHHPSLESTPTPTYETLAVLSVNEYNSNILVSILSDDGNLEIIRQNGDIVIVNPTNSDWTPDPKYHVYRKTAFSDIRQFLNTLDKPIRFAFIFDYTDLFDESFWEMFQFISQDTIYHNSLVMVTMNMPHDEVDLAGHVDELKNIIQNADWNNTLGYFDIVGMHEIITTGPVKDMQELEAEVLAIKPNF